MEAARQSVEEEGLLVATVLEVESVLVVQALPWEPYLAVELEELLGGKLRKMWRSVLWTVGLLFAVLE